ncbi:hypothetical protein VKS41_005639 [Umbelopsis sp. WA50703]|jgi:nitrite reductase/ring-hydroxylating ferredoxin subunit
MFVPTIKGSKPEPLSTLNDSIASLKIDSDSVDSSKMSDNDHVNKEKVQSKDATSITNIEVASQPKVVDSPETCSTPASDKDTSSPEASDVETPDEKDSAPAKVIPIVEEEEVEASITLAEHDKERIIVTLPNGTRYEADRYCPHAGADMYTHGQISLDEYGPEVGPILLCPMHYWEFLLDKEGNSTNGWATLDACKLKDKACPVEGDSKLAW